MASKAGNFFICDEFAFLPPDQEQFSAVESTWVKLRIGHEKKYAPLVWSGSRMWILMTYDSSKKAQDAVGNSLVQ